MRNIAAEDQAAAKERDFDRRAQRAAAVFLALAAVGAIYCIFAALGVVPAAPWSPLGQ